LNFSTGDEGGSAMRTCEACGRDFPFWRGRSYTCPYCGYNTHPRGHMPRTEQSLQDLEQERLRREEQEADLRECFDLEPN